DYVKRVRRTTSDTNSGRSDGRDVPSDGRDVPSDSRDVPSDGKNLPATLEDDLALARYLGDDLSALVGSVGEQRGFVKGVKAMSLMQSYNIRQLGQLMTIPTNANAAALKEVWALANSAQPKTDPALVAALNSTSQSIAKMAAPKTPQAMMVEAFLPTLTGVLGNVMAVMGKKMPAAGQPGKPGQQPGVEQATQADINDAFGQPNIE
ncbi:unnamed protein product, partial [marine sediment metagenome]